MNAEPAPIKLEDENEHENQDDFGIEDYEGIGLETVHGDSDLDQVAG